MAAQSAAQDAKARRRLSSGTEVVLRRSARARRISLRVSRTDGAVTLTLPVRVSESEALAFAESKIDWITRAAAGAPQIRLVAPGAVLPVEGQGMVITPAAVRRVTAADGRLLVPQGRPVGTVVSVYLRHLAHQRLTVSAGRHAHALGRPFRAIALRDTRSRWGSCTSDGRLMFSWRLAMAPPEILDYVAAHEVAHLAHMDHSPRFWATVEQLLPGHARHRGWLRSHGGGLQAWVFRAAAPA
ncbi:M48 family metallopeptidase [Paracoccus pacificus]|uniref:M48 family metallopeptidase n=1 Tax=Paracoccus pacificus TaxID=1463598 RepID=A0ABW4R5Y2_9RHOB